VVFVQHFGYATVHGFTSWLRLSKAIFSVIQRHANASHGGGGAINAGF